MIKYFVIFFVLLSNANGSDLLNITFLGTGTPRPNLDKLGPSILIKANQEELLIDVGRGITLRLNQIGNNYSKINNIYLSHMHYDHIIGLADFWLTSNLWQKKTDTNIYGPKGVKKFCDGLMNSYQLDLKYRYEGNNYSKLKCINFSEISMNNNKILVTPFTNDHGHVDNSYGFKISFNDKSIVYSGDTTLSKNVVNNAKGTDILIHEIIATSKKVLDNNKKLRKVFKSHTNINQIIKVLNTCKPKLTILNHALLFGVNEEYVLREIKKSYSGNVIFSKDLMSIDLGEEHNIFNIGK